MSKGVIGKQLNSKTIFTTCLVLVFFVLFFAHQARANYMYYNADTGKTIFSNAIDVNGNLILSGGARTLQIGDSGAQSLYFVNSSNGISHTNNQLQFNTTQSLGFTFIGGNVGIGTTAPGAKLEVSSADTGSGLLRLRNQGSGTGNINGIDAYWFNDAYGVPKGYLRWQLQGSWGTQLNFGVAHDTNNATTAMSIDQHGNVGIGVTTPGSKLEVYGDAIRLFGSENKSAARLIDGGANDVGYLQLYNNNVLTTQIGASATYFNDGNIGIGTTAPDAKLDITDGALVNRTALANHYRNVLTTYLGHGSLTGTLKIVLPKQSDTMIDITIKGYDYSGIGAWEARVSGYVYNSTGGGWYTSNHKAQIIGSAPFSQIRLAYDGAKPVILLGTTTTSWAYSSVEVSDVTATYGSITGWGTGWTASLVTSEAGLTTIATPAIHTYTSSSGNFGIGTTNPGAKLDVSGGGSFTLPVTVGSPTAAGHAVTLSYLQSAIATSSDSAVGFWTKASGKLYPTDTSLNVGIGTTTPVSILEVYKNTNDSAKIRITNINGGSSAYSSLQFTADVGSAEIWRNNSARTNYGGASALNIYQSGAYPIAFFQGASEIMRIHTNGNVGVGTTNPGTILQVKEIAQNSNVMTLGTASGSFSINATGAYGLFAGVKYNTGDVWMQVGRSDGNATPYNLLLQPSGGYVGIGTTTPDAILNISGKLKLASIGTIYNQDSSRWLDFSGVLPTSLAISGHIKQGTLVARPYATWGVGGNSTGAVIIKIPGTVANYGMIHLQIDTYEYGSNYATTYICGGHNWNTAWYNYTCNTLGISNKKIRLAVKDNQYAVVIGDNASTWSYGQVALTKIINGGYYSGTMDLGGTYTITQDASAESYTWISADLNRFNAGSAYFTGNVGIGGSGVLNQRLAVRGTTSDPSLAVGSYALASFGVPTHVQLAINSQVASPYSISLQVKHETTDGNSYPLALNPLGGNVGIGTTNPGGTSATGLSAPNQVLELKTATGNYINAIYLRRNDNATGLDITNEGAGTGIVYLDSRYNSGSSGGFQFRTNTAGTPQNSLRLDGNGNVGIGTTNPLYKLDVNGSVRFNNLAYGLTPGASMPSALATVEYVNAVAAGTSSVPTVGYWTASGNNIYSANSGNVGIGTTAPGVGNILNVKGATPSGTLGFRDSSRYTGQIYIEANEAYSTQKGGRIAFGGVAGNNGGAFAGYTRQDSVFGTIEGYKANAIADNAGGGLFFSTNLNTDGTLYERMRITDNGNVGIGTTNPTARLNIVEAGPASDWDSLKVDFQASGVANGYNTSAGRFINTMAFSSQSKAIGVLGEAIKTGHYGDTGTGAEGRGIFRSNSLGVSLSGLSLYGVSGKVSVEGTGANTINSGKSLYAYVNVDAGNTLSTYHGVYVKTPTGAGTITNKYALVTEENAGNVGIGLTNPANRLSVLQAGAVGGESVAAVNWKSASYNLGYLGAENSTYNSGAVYIYRDGAANTKISGNGLSYLMGGYVGIAKSIPTTILDVVGGANFTGTVNAIGLCIDADCLTRWPWKNNGNDVYNNPTTGNVGIGTTNPQAKLQVAGGIILNRTAVTASTYTASSTDYIIAFPSLSANATVVLPNVLCTPGRVYLIVNESTSTFLVTINPEGTTLISGEETVSLPANNSTPVYCGNMAWYIY